ncbi:MAG: hypothetical protein Q8O43_07835 [Dehalococcoidia bacterium]|nr:hypothetical protein [Dehalococcoidia bacterium]
MKLWKRVKSVSVERRSVCQKCRICLQLTGEPPNNPSECLIIKIVGESKSVPLKWLKERISDNLYRDELWRGGWATDIGLWGPAVFTKAAVQILSDIRPQFACLVNENETGSTESNKTCLAKEA